jgi:hypothetical protein
MRAPPPGSGQAAGPDRSQTLEGVYIVFDDVPDEEPMFGQLP